MPRLSQTSALQIATVGFAMLSVALGVTLFLSARRCDELRAEVKAVQAAADRSQTTAEEAQEASRELRTLLGFTASERLPAVREQAAQDMESCAAALPEPCRSYRTALSSLRDLVRNQGMELSRQKTDIKSLAAKFDHREEANAGQVEQFRKAADQSRKELRDKERDVAAESEFAREAKSGLDRKMDQVRQEATQKVLAADRKLDVAQKKCAELATENERLQKELQEYISQSFTTAHGQVRRVSAQLHTAWIELGSSDAVRPRVLFNVYPGTAASLNPSTEKGVIRVNGVDGGTVVAKIIEDNPGDPLVPGDKVHAPGWRPAK